MIGETQKKNVAVTVPVHRISIAGIVDGYLKNVGNVNVTVNAMKEGKMKKKKMKKMLIDLTECLQRHAVEEDRLRQEYQGLIKRNEALQNVNMKLLSENEMLKTESAEQFEIITNMTTKTQNLIHDNQSFEAENKELNHQVTVRVKEIHDLNATIERMTDENRN